MNHAKQVNMDNVTFQRRIMKAFAVVLISIPVLVGGVAHATSTDPCRHEVEGGDTLWQLAIDHDTTVDRLAQWNSIHNRDRIDRGETLIVCLAAPHGSGSLNTEPRLVDGRLVQWAEAVTDNRPEWADDHMVRFMVSVTHFESSGCKILWNPNDEGWENGVHYSGSYGCNQIRVRSDNSVQHRNLEWLRDNYDHQAKAAWIIFGERHLNGINPYRAWGPTHNTARYGTKLHQDGSCGGTWKPAECEKAWANADAALASVGGLQAAVRATDHGAS